MAKKSNYDKIYEHNAEFLQNYYSMYKNKQEHDGDGNFSKEYSRLIQAKKRLVDSYQNAIEDSLLFSEMIRIGTVKQESREQAGFHNILKKNPVLDNLHLYFDDDEKIPNDFKHGVNNKLNSLQIEVSQEIFSEKQIKRLIDSVFQFNYSSYNDLLSEDQIEYYAKVAALMVRRGIHELRKYIDYQYANLLFQDLEHVEQICRIIEQQKDRTLHEWV